MPDEPTRADIKADTEELIHKAETNPTNADLFVGQEEVKKMFETHATEDHNVAENQKKVNDAQVEVNKELTKSLASIHIWKETVATREDISNIVNDSISDFLKLSGKRGYAGLLIFAGIISSIVIIGGGLKTLLGWVGIILVKKL